MDNQDLAKKLLHISRLLSGEDYDRAVLDQSKPGGILDSLKKKRLKEVNPVLDYGDRVIISWKKEDRPNLPLFLLGAEGVITETEGIMALVKIIKVHDKNANSLVKFQTEGKYYWIEFDYLHYTR